MRAARFLDTARRAALRPAGMDVRPAGAAKPDSYRRLNVFP
jgi:hypothetical protein